MGQKLNGSPFMISCSNLEAKEKNREIRMILMKVSRFDNNVIEYREFWLKSVL